MSTSAARIEANRQNASKSTGPKTERGKATSRRNALKHGLTATVVDVEPALDRPEPRLDPEWLADQAARTMARIDRAHRAEGRLRLEAAWRATAVWDEDRRLDAENVAASLTREPSRTVARLRQTPAGCDWLIARWEALARAADADEAGAWTPDEARLAFDLLGAPGPGRTERFFDTLPAGDPAPATRAAYARAMIRRLHDHRADVADADEIARVAVEADHADTPTPDLARLRRYDLALHRRLQWLLAEHRARAANPPEPAPIPAQPRPERNEPNAPGPVDETNPTPTLPPPHRPPTAEARRPAQALRHARTPAGPHTAATTSHDGTATQTLSVALG